MQVTMKNEGGFTITATDATGAMKNAARREQSETSAKEQQALDAIRKRREKDERNRLTPIERMESASEGLQRLAKRLTRHHEAAGPKVQELAVDAKAHFKAYMDAEKRQAKLKGDPIRDAIETAAKTLFKVLGKTVFPTMADALAFAERALPLNDARHAANQLHDQRHKCDRERKAAADAFWLTIEKGVKIGGIGCDNIAVDTLIKMGDM